MAGASRRSLAERLEAWSGVCDAAAAGELADADASAALVSVVFASLREHDDKPSRVALARAVDAALMHSPAFLKAFAARLLKAASDAPQAMEPARRRELLRWSCALVRHLDLATQTGAFAKVAKAQGDLLCAEATAASGAARGDENGDGDTRRGVRAPPRVNASFQRLLGASVGASAAAEAYVDLVSPRADDGTPDPAKALVVTAPAAACGLAGALVAWANAAAATRAASGGSTKRPSKVQRRGGEAEAAKREEQLAATASRARAGAADAFARGVLHGDARNPSKLPTELGRALDAFVATMTEEEMRDEVAPRIERQMRRSPEATLRPTRRALERAPAPAARALAAAAGDALAAQLRHADAWRREEAAACFAAIADLGEDEDARGAFDAVAGDLADAAKRPKEWQARCGVFDAMARLALRGDGVSEKTAAACANEAVACLADAFAREAQRDARASAADALGAWLAKVPGALPKPAADALAASLKDAKDAEKVRPALRLLVRAAKANPTVLGSGTSVALMPALAALVKAGSAKPLQRAEGTMALFLVAAAAAGDAEARKAAVSAGAFGALAPDATYFAPASLARLGAEDSECAALGVGALLGSVDSRELLGGDVERAAIGTATLLLLHPNRETRVAAKRAVDAANEAGVSAETLLDAFREWVVSAEEPGRWPGLELSVEEAASGNAARRPFPRRLAGAALAAFCGAGGAERGAASRVGFSRGDPGIPPELAGRLVLLAHHPLVSAPDGRQQGAWSALLAKLDAAAERLGLDPPEFALRECADAMCAAVAGDTGARSPRPADRDAAVAAAFAVARIDPDVALDAILGLAQSFADAREHESLTEKEIAIFRCPPTRLSTDPVDVFKPVTRASANGARKARGKGRGAYGSDSDSDDEPAAVSLRPTLRASQVAAAGGRGAGRGGRGGRGGANIPDKAELARRAQFAEEAETRARVRDGVDRLCLRLRLTAAVLRGGTRRGAAAKRVARVATELLPLAASPILPEGPGAALGAALVVAAANVPGNASVALGFRGVASAFAAALRVSARCLDGTAPPLEPDARGDPAPVPCARAAAEAATLEHALDALCECVEMNDTEPLPPAMAFLAFPLCARVLTLADDVAPASMRKNAVRVLAAHAAPGVPGLPRAAAARLALGVMATGAGATAAAARPLLLDVAAGSGDEAPAVTLALLDGLESEFRAVRAAALAALAGAPGALRDLVLGGPEDARRSAAARLFLVRRDVDKAVRAAADDVWRAAGLELDAATLAARVSPLAILPFLRHAAASAREAAVDAFAETAAAMDGGVAPALAKLFAAYATAAPAAPARDGEAELLDRGSAVPDRARFPDELERARRRSAGDPQGRAALVRALGAAAPSLTARDLPLVSTFLTKVLADEDEAVRDAAMRGGRAMIELHGAQHVQQLLGVYEGYFDRATRSGGAGDLTDAQTDNTRQGVAVFLGSLAAHLEQTDPRLRQILARLVDVLSTPSEAVQRSVADCLPSLARALDEDERRALAESLLAQVTGGAGYADRRGAAFGLAGAVKGMGIGSLKLFGVMDTVKTAVEDKSNPEAREGALMAFELLNVRLGRLFEPYVVHVLPLLLVCFGDQNAYVREATVSAARAVMGQLSGQGVKLVLPALMRGLEDSAWRTKQGSVQLLGAMSACAPKQLGACLPQIVPKLSETLTDTHPKVVDAANAALAAIGDVIRNPEIRGLSKYLLGAISAPAERTAPCLDVLLEMTFVNTVDAPSLALIVPVLSRGLRDRSADLKKKAAKIAGNMCSLVADAKDMSPYVPILLPDIQKSLVDVSPEVRATAAAALASLLQGMGGAEADQFSEVIPWLTRTLQSDGPPTERSGAAQGLAECLAVLGPETFEAMLPEIFAGCAHVAPYVREGHLTLLRFLPLALGAAFEAHLKEALTEVLTGLADISEPVRQAALGAGRVFVEEFSHSGPSLDLLLPAIEEALANENWRIRQSATELLGSMMFRIAGTSGKVRVEGGDDDEGISTEAQGALLTSALGEARHHDLLASVYALRSDPVMAVRSAAVHIWKTVVANTPRTLRVILPRLMRRLIAGLSAESEDRRQTAGKCLGELVRKLGERVLPEIFPILRDGLEPSRGVQTRQGVCLGLAEVLAAARKEQLDEFLHRDVVPAIRDALCDADAAVREAAGAAFDATFRHSGPDTAAAIVPALLSKLGSDDAALEGLKQVLKAQPKILASVLPKLAEPPIDAHRASTLGALAEVAGAALPPHLEALFPPLLAAMASEAAEEAEAARHAASAVLRAVPDDAHYLLLPQVLGGARDERPRVRAAAATLCGAFAVEAPCFDEEDDVPLLIEALFSLFCDADETVVLSAWQALGVVMGAVAKEDQAHYLRDVRAAVRDAREKMRRRLRDAGASARVKKRDLLVPGLCLPKGLAPVAQVFLQGVLAGRNADARESAAEGLREATLSTTTAAVKPHVIPVTGPLIRALGDKHPGSVKSAVIGALAAMIEVGGAALKPFVPQLQTTFVKCLVDPHRAVRQRAAAALGRLVALQPRVDALVADLVASLERTDESSGSVDEETRGARRATARAVAGALARAGANVKPPTVVAATEAAMRLGRDAADAETRAAAALALAHAAAWLPEDARATLAERLGETDAGAGDDADAREHRALSLSASARVHPELVLASPETSRETLNGLARHARDPEREGARVAAVLGMGRLALASAEQRGAACPFLGKVASALARALRDDGAGARAAAASALSRLCAASPDAVAPHLGVFVPALADVAVADASRDARFHADRALRAALRVRDEEDGLAFAREALRAGGAAHAARARLSDVVLRRLQGLPALDEGADGTTWTSWGGLAADADDDDEAVLGDDA